MQLTMTERFLDEVFNDFMAVRQEWSDQGADNKYTSSSRGRGQAHSPGLARAVDGGRYGADIGGDTGPGLAAGQLRAPGGRPMG